MVRIKRRLPSECFVFLCAALLICSLATDASAQLDQWGYWNNGVSESWWFSSADFTKEAAVATVERWHDIGADISISENGLGGDYFRGSETHGIFLRWSRNSGFVMANVDKCQAKVMSLSYGRVKVSPEIIEFIPELNKSGKSHGHSHSALSQLKTMKFVPVKWGRGLMLIDEIEMSDFGDFLAGLGKYNYSDFRYLYVTEFFTRQSGEKSNDAETRPVSDDPIVPESFRRFLKQPITATIVHVGSTVVKKTYSYENPDGSGSSHFEPVSITRVIINVGTQHGLKKGMFLQVVNPSEGDSVRIIRVNKTRSIGIIVRDLWDDGSEKFVSDDPEKPQLHSRIRAGWKLTTSHF